jgi:hypothetical protein
MYAYLDEFHRSNGLETEKPLCPSGTGLILMAKCIEEFGILGHAHDV